MKISSTSPVLLDAKGHRISVEEVIENARLDKRRVLADDEIGTVLYVGDLDLFTVTGIGHPQTGTPSPDSQGFWVKKISQLSTVRFASSMLRHQIGSTVISVAADGVFVVRDGNRLLKVRGDHLQAGMVLETGEKVYW